MPPSVDGRKCSSRKCCAIEGYLPLHVIWIEPCFPPSTGFRSQDIDTASGYVMSRAASLTRCLADLAAAFIELCAATLALCQWNNLVWLSNCCSPLHWGQILNNIRLEGPKKCMLAILLCAGWIYGGTAIIQAFPTIWLLRGHLVEKNEIFLGFQTLFEQTSDMGERILQKKESQQCGIKFFNTKRDAPSTKRTAMIIWVLLINYAHLMIDISRIDRFFIRGCI